MDSNTYTITVGSICVCAIDIPFDNLGIIFFQILWSDDNLDGVIGKMEKTGKLDSWFVEVVTVIGVISIKNFFLLSVIDENLFDFGLFFHPFFLCFPQFVMMRWLRIIINVFDKGWSICLWFVEFTIFNIVLFLRGHPLKIKNICKLIFINHSLNVWTNTILIYYIQKFKRQSSSAFSPSVLFHYFFYLKTTFRFDIY